MNTSDYIHTHTHTHTYICIYIHTHIYICVYICIYMCVCIYIVCVCVYTHIHALLYVHSIYSGVQKTVDPLKLELQQVWSHLNQMLGTEPVSFTKAASTSNSRGVSLVLRTQCLMKYMGLIFLIVTYIIPN